ncbi:SH3 domain-containing protein [Aphelenchoides bicaudatus]|nr:SH3 domain-containing protein [Aphelenchoides bicaudatus]
MPPLPPKPGRVRAYYINEQYEPNNDIELNLNEGDMIFVEEGTGDYLNIICGDKRGKLSSKYVNSAQDSIVSVEYPMHEAAKRGNLDFVRECLKNKISANSLDTSGSTALYWASLNGHLDVVLELLKQPNISMPSQNKLGDTALHAASRKGRIECAKVLIEHGACVFTVNKDNKKPIQLAQNPEMAALIKLTMDRLPEPTDQNEYASSEDEQ